MPLINLLPAAISDLFAQVRVTGKITLVDRYGRMATWSNKSISEEIYCIDRLFYALRKGQVQAVCKRSVSL